MAPTIDEVFLQVKFLREHGRGQEKAVLVLPAEEAKQRIANAGPKPKTRFIMETDDPEMYSRLNRQKDRWFNLLGNKSVAVDMLCRMWEEPNDEAIVAFGDDESQRDSGVPRAIIPQDKFCNQE